MFAELEDGMLIRNKCSRTNKRKEHLLQYSNQARASSSVPVPIFKQMNGSAPMARQNVMNSSVPNWLLSSVSHASSGRLGRFSLGPTPSVDSDEYNAT